MMLLVGLLVVVGLLILLSVVYRLPPAPKRAIPYVDPECRIPTDPGQPIEKFSPENSSGVFKGVELLADWGTRIVVKKSLTIVCDGEIEFRDPIRIDPTESNDPVHLTIASRNGNIVIVGGIDHEYAPPIYQHPALPVTPLVVAEAGVNGGDVRLLAPEGSVDIRAHIEAVSGGGGGFATADNLPGPGGKKPPAPFPPRTHAATAVAGQAGHGGSVLICAHTP